MGRKPLEFMPLCKIAALFMFAALSSTSYSADIATEPLQTLGFGRMEGLCLSADGELLATGGDGVIHLWDAKTGKDTGAIENTGKDAPKAFSADGSRLLSYALQCANVWDVSSGEHVRALPHDSSVWSIAFSADGTRVLTGCTDRVARLWNVSNGQLLQTFHVGFSMFEVAISPDNSKVYTSSDYGKLWDAETGEVIHTFQTAGKAVFSANGSRLLIGVMLFDTETLAVIRYFSESGSVAAISADGSKVIIGNQNVVNVWDVESTQPVSVMQTIADFVTAVAFTDDGPVAGMGAGNFTSGIYNVETGELVCYIGEHSGPVMDAKFSPDGEKVLTGLYDGSWRLWDLATNRTLMTHFDFPGMGMNQVTSVAFSTDGKSFAVGNLDYKTRIWDAETGDFIRALNHSERVRSIAFSQDASRILTGNSDNNAHLWDAETGAHLRTFSGHTDDVYSVAFSPDGDKILTGSIDATARLWDVETGASLHTFNHTDVVLSVAYSPCGTRVLTGSHDATVKLWDSETGALLREFAEPDKVRKVAFSPDGRRILSDVWYFVRQLCVETGALIRTYERASIFSAFSDFSPDGAMVMTSNNRNVRIWRSARVLSVSSILAENVQIEGDLEGHAGFTASVDHGATLNLSVPYQYSDDSTSFVFAYWMVDDIPQEPRQTSVDIKVDDDKTIVAVYQLDGDVNGDCTVNILDLIFVRNQIESSPDTPDVWRADVNRDGSVDLLDLMYVRKRFGSMCP